MCSTTRWCGRGPTSLPLTLLVGPIMNNHVLTTSISSDRQDRYLLIRDPAFAKYCHELVHLFACSPYSTHVPRYCTPFPATFRKVNDVAHEEPPTNGQRAGGYPASPSASLSLSSCVTTALLDALQRRPPPAPPAVTVPSALTH